MILKRRVYNWHRWSSALATLPLLMWASSAILHQANVWFKPDFRTASYGMPFEKSNTDSIHTLVKSLYLADAKVKSIQRIESFNHNYSAKNKVLPVFEVSVESANQTILYLDLTGGKIVTGSNRTSRAIHKWFGYLHKWEFIKSWPILRTSLIVLFSSINLLAGWLGIYLYFLLPWLNKKELLTSAQNQKRWHRRIGIAVSVFMILFAVTGLLHAISDLYPGLERFEKPLFNQLHMYRFTEGFGKQFRFWWLFTLAASFILLLSSGMILLTRFILRRMRC